MVITRNDSIVLEILGDQQPPNSAVGPGCSAAPTWAGSALQARRGRPVLNVVASDHTALACLRQLATTVTGVLVWLVVKSVSSGRGDRPPVKSAFEVIEVIEWLANDLNVIAQI